jgi:hypothetical protein
MNTSSAIDGSWIKRLQTGHFKHWIKNIVIAIHGKGRNLEIEMVADLRFDVFFFKQIIELMMEWKTVICSRNRKKNDDISRQILQHKCRCVWSLLFWGDAFLLFLFFCVFAHCFPSCLASLLFIIITFCYTYVTAHWVTFNGWRGIITQTTMVWIIIMYNLQRYINDDILLTSLHWYLFALIQS